MNRIQLDRVRIFRNFVVFIGLGGMTVMPFLISNYCSLVDSVSLKLWFVNFYLSRFHHNKCKKTTSLKVCNNARPTSEKLSANIKQVLIIVGCSKLVCTLEYEAYLVYEAPSSSEDQRSRQQGHIKSEHEKKHENMLRRHLVVEIYPLIENQPTRCWWQF